MQGIYILLHLELLQLSLLLPTGDHTGWHDRQLRGGVPLALNNINFSRVLTGRVRSSCQHNSQAKDDGGVLGHVVCVPARCSNMRMRPEP